MNREFPWSETEILITGGTGSLGNALTRYLLKYKKPRGIRILSRDEVKQGQMKQALIAEGYKGNVAFFPTDRIRGPFSRRSTS